MGAHQHVVEASYGHGEHVAVGHVAHALFTETEFSAQFVGEVLVVGELAQHARTVQVGAAIAHVGDHQIPAIPQRHDDGGPHALTLGPHPGGIDYLLVG